MNVASPMTAGPAARVRSELPVRRGVSMVELLISLVLLALVMAVLTSAFVIARHALPDPDGPVEARARARETLDAINRDLFCATGVTVSGDTMIELEVVRRGAPVTVRYEWLGTPTASGSLTRQIDGGSVVSLLDDAYLFSTQLELETIEVEVPPTPVESPEETVASHVSVGNLTDALVTGTDWWGQTLAPLVPAEAVLWSVSDVMLHLRQSGADAGRIRIQMRPALPDGTPDPSVLLEEVVVMESSLNPGSEYYAWTIVSFSSVTDVPVDQRLCLLLSSEYAEPSCDFRYNSAGASVADSGFLASSDAGASWQYTPTKALRYLAHGTYTTLSATQMVDEDRVVAAQVSLQSTASPDTLMTCQTSLLNEPVPVVLP